MALSEGTSSNATPVVVALDRGMSLRRHVLLTSTTAVVIALSSWASGAWAQETQSTEAQGEQPQTVQPSGDTAQSAADTAPERDDASDTLVATVGDAEIRTSDLRRAIGALPQPLSSQPPELVASAALQQLLVRQTILQQARSAGLEQDPEVQALVAAAMRRAEEDALVQVWLQRELESRVPPQAVDQAYAALQAITTGDLPPLEQVRPQIEENLRRQAVEDIQATLLTGADITFYGPDGEPRSGTADPVEQDGAGNQDITGGEQTEDQGSQPADSPTDDQAADPGQGQAVGTEGDAGGQPAQDGN